MSTEPRVAFINSRILGDQGSIEDVLEVMKLDRYMIVTSEQDESVMSEKALRERLAEAYTEKTFSFDFRRVGEKLELHIYGGWGTGWFSESSRSWFGVSTVNTSLFMRELDEARYYSNLLLNLATKLYAVLLPAFGWIDISDPAGDTWFDEVEQVMIPRPYWANFLGPEYVERYGQAVLDARFNGKKAPLSDGGVCYVVSDSLGQRP